MWLALSLALPVASAADRPTPAEVEVKLEKALDRVEATPEQRERITSIVEDARDRRDAFREEGRALRTELRDLILAESIDRKAVEQVRREVVALFDRASSFALDRVVRVAEVLTPEQRAEIRAHLQDHAQ